MIYGRRCQRSAFALLECRTATQAKLQAECGSDVRSIRERRAELARVSGMSGKSKLHTKSFARKIAGGAIRILDSAAKRAEISNVKTSLHESLGRFNQIFKYIFTLCSAIVSHMLRCYFTYFGIRTGAGGKGRASP